MAWQHRVLGRRQQIEDTVEPLGDLLRGENRRSRSCQFDCQWQAFEPAADLNDRPHVFFRYCKPRIGGAHAVERRAPPRRR